MKHKIEIAPNLAICIDGKRVIGAKPHGLFLTTEMIVSDEDLKRLSDRCLEVIADTPQTEMDKCYKCKWWNYSYGCSNKKGVCDFEPTADTPQTERNE